MKNFNLVSFLAAMAFTSNSLAVGTMTVSTLSNLTFGKVAANSGGAVILNPVGSRTTAGGVAVLSSDSGSAARFRLQGTIGQSYTLSLPLNNEVLLSSDTNTMRVTDFTISPAPSGALDGTGSQVVALGATLNIESNKPPGDYSGTFSITVDYQ